MLKTAIVTTTMISLAAGGALANEKLTFGGEAKIGAKSVNGGDTFNADANVVLNVGFADATDDGIEYGASFSIESGNLADSANGASAVGTVKAPSLYVRGPFGELYGKQNDDDEALVGYTNTFDSTTFGLEYNTHADSANMTIAQQFDLFKVSANYKVFQDDAIDDEWGIGLGYDNGSYNAGIEFQHDDDVKLTAGTSVEGFTFSGEYLISDSADDEWKVTAAYAVEQFEFSLAYEHDEDYAFTSKYKFSSNLNLYATTKIEDQGAQEITFGVGMTF